jgi:hypothetical protein
MDRPGHVIETHGSYGSEGRRGAVCREGVGQGLLDRRRAYADASTSGGRRAPPWIAAAEGSPTPGRSPRPSRRSDYLPCRNPSICRWGHPAYLAVEHGSDAGRPRD